MEIVHNISRPANDIAVGSIWESISQLKLGPRRRLHRFELSEKPLDFGLVPGVQVQNRSTRVSPGYRTQRVGFPDERQLMPQRLESFVEFCACADRPDASCNDDSSDIACHDGDDSAENDRGNVEVFNRVILVTEIHLRVSKRIEHRQVIGK